LTEVPDAVGGLRAALADRYKIERELGQGGISPKSPPTPGLHALIDVLA
jgi:hypothetical protein